MQEITDYAILSSYSKAAIEKRIKKHLILWYGLQGGVFKNWGIYYQAIIKKNPELWKR